MDQQGGPPIPDHSLRAEAGGPLRRAEALVAAEPTRERLHALLDAALDLTEAASSGSDFEEAITAAWVVQQLLDLGFGPLANRLMEAGQPADAEARGGDKTHAEIRRDLARGVTVFPSLMGEADRSVIAVALLDLNSRTAEVPPLLVRERKRGRGANPGAAEEAEERAWQWIWQQHGRTGGKDWSAYDAGRKRDWDHGRRGREMARGMGAT
ncbi:MAG: hypothetical protein JO046_26140 [Solirubrobacterales bacterium]|nr:hypothetical protein [Solirubrobacterales bacterium]